jgi:hypothetical protein
MGRVRENALIQIGNRSIHQTCSTRMVHGLNATDCGRQAISCQKVPAIYLCSGGSVALRLLKRWPAGFVTPLPEARCKEGTR